MISEQNRLYTILILTVLLSSSQTFAENLIKDIEFNKTELGSEIIILKSGSNQEEPKIFTTQAPATIAIDFHNTRLALDNNRIEIGEKNIRNVIAVETQKKSRVIVDL